MILIRVDARGVSIVGEEDNKFAFVEGEVFGRRVVVEDDIALGVELAHRIEAFVGSLHAKSLLARQRHLYVDILSVSLESSQLFRLAISRVDVDINILAIEFDVSML